MTKENMNSNPEVRRRNPLGIPGVPVKPIETPRRNPNRPGAPWEKPRETPQDPSHVPNEDDPVKIGTPDEPVREPA